MFTTLLFLAWTIKPQSDTIPFRQPQLAAAHGQVAMAFGGGSSIYFAASPDNGATFAKPVKVAETGALALGRHRGPRLIILKDALLISAIAGEKVATGTHAHGLPEAGNLIVWRSTDKGVTWKQASVINDVPGAAREGLHAIAAAANGKLFAVWLDLREKGTQLYGSQSADGGVTWSKNALVYSSPDGTICQCCHPSLTIDAKGGVWAMWRNVLDGSRDMHLIHSANGEKFEDVRKLGQGTWKLNACPMDGGGFVVDKDGKVTSAWRRDGEIILDEAGKPERSIGAGKDVAIARSKRGVYAAWTKDSAVHVLEPGASESKLIGPAGGFASLLALRDGSILAAWEANGSIETAQLK
jgi:hypothetical protein